MKKFNQIKKILFFLCFLFYINLLFSKQSIVKIWEDVKNCKAKTQMYVFEPEDSKKNGIVAIICPGGSYQHLMGIKTEGFDVAQWLNNQGVTACVLKYRVNKNGYHHPAMIEDLQQSINYVRSNAEKYKINPNSLCVIGFSAGGHLALMSAAFYDTNFLEKYNIKPQNLKPNFIAPIYPVVSMQDNICHKRSRKNLLGNKFNEDKKNKFSMELQMREDSPPIFLVATEDDPVVDYKNSVELNKRIENQHIKNCELHLYKIGGHGFGMDENRGGEAAKWKFEFINWLKNLVEQENSIKE